MVKLCRTCVHHRKGVSKFDTSGQKVGHFFSPVVYIGAILAWLPDLVQSIELDRNYSSLVSNKVKEDFRSNLLQRETEVKK